MTRKLNDTKELDKFKLALDHAPVAVFIMDKNWNFEYINPEFERLSGYTNNELLHKNIGDSLYKNVQGIPESRREIIAHLNEGKSWKGELLTINKTGSSYWAETTASPYKNENGEIEGYIVIQNDVTEKKNMELALKESELLYRTLLENSTDGIALTQNSTIIIANKKFCTLIGYSPDELKLIEPTTIIAPHDRDRVLDLHYSRMRGEIDHAISYTADFMRKDGSIFTAELGATTISINGQNASYVTMRDITERLRMERELAQSLKKYRDFAEMLPQTVYELDMEGRQTYMNKAGLEMFGHTGNGIGHLAFDSIAPEDHERMRDNMNKNFQNSKDYTVGNEYTAVRCDGTRFPVIVYAAPIIENGIATGTRGIIIDISERKAMENALRESELKYKTLVENSQDGIMMVREDKMLFANDTLCNMLKYNCRDLFENPASNIIHPDDRAKVFDILKRRLNGEKGIITDELRLKTEDDRIIYASISSSIVDYQGKPASFYTIHDISKRKAMENALRESEMKYKTLVENSQDGIFALLGDKLHFVNNTFCRMMGYKPEEMYQLNPYQLILESDYETANAIRERRKMGDTSTISGIFRYKTNDGRVLECETYSSVIEMEGQQMSYVTVHDLTETRKMQEQLQQSEKKYRTLINKATDGILITQGGVFKFVNPAFCEMMQYNENELINKPFIEVVDKEHHAEMLNNHQRRMSGESFPAIYRAKLFRKDGSSLMVELNSRTTDFNGNPASFVITRDITDRLKAEEELLKAKTELEQLNQSLEARVRESSENLAKARTQLIRLQKENLQSQFEVLRQQVNPHFLFNSLNVLTSLIKLEPDLAEKFTEHLSKVYRYVLENKDNDLVDLKTELDFLDAYLFLLNIRFMDKIQVSINIDKEKTDLLILPLALQLLIENAIKHNSMSKKNPLCIKLFIDENNFLNVVNNLQERESYIASTGVGLKNIEHRYLLLELPAPEFIKTENEFFAKVPLKKC